MNTVCSTPGDVEHSQGSLSYICYTGYTGMCCCILGYGFQGSLSQTGYIQFACLCLEQGIYSLDFQASCPLE